MIEKKNHQRDLQEILTHPFFLPPFLACLEPMPRSIDGFKTEATIFVQFIEGSTGIFIKLCRKIQKICDQKLTDAAEAQLARLQKRRQKKRVAQEHGQVTTNEC